MPGEGTGNLAARATLRVQLTSVIGHFSLVIWHGTRHRFTPPVSLTNEKRAESMTDEKCPANNVR